MQMSDFLALFYSSSVTRRRALGHAQATGGPLNDLAFLAAVDQWKNGKHGKKNAQQIHITFCIPVRGGGAPNPFVISPATQVPLPACLTQLTHDMIAVTKDIVANKAKERAISAASSSGGVFGSVKAFQMKAVHKVKTPQRAVGDGLFDAVTAAVCAPGTPLDAWVTPMLSIPAVALDGGDQHVKDLVRLLGAGKAGGHMNTDELGF